MEPVYLEEGLQADKVALQSWPLKVDLETAPDGKQKENMRSANLSRLPVRLSKQKRYPI
jgi:hypothetical protein